MLAFVDADSVDDDVALEFEVEALDDEDEDDDVDALEELDVDAAFGVDELLHAAMTRTDEKTAAKTSFVDFTTVSTDAGGAEIAARCPAGRSPSRQVACSIRSPSRAPGGGWWPRTPRAR